MLTLACVYLFQINLNPFISVNILWLTPYQEIFLLDHFVCFSFFLYQKHSFFSYMFCPIDFPNESISKRLLNMVLVKHIRRRTKWLL